MTQLPSCRDCQHCKCVDITDTTGLKATAHVCGRTGKSADLERMARTDKFGLTVEHPDDCGPFGRKFVARAM